MKKRLFCILMALVMMFTLLPVSVLAEGDEPNMPDGGYTDPLDPNQPVNPEPPADPNQPVNPEPPADSNQPLPVDDPITPAVMIIALKNQSTEKLSGGKFALKNSSDETLEEWTTEEGEFIFDYLDTDGTYVLEQTAAPAYYEFGAETKWQIEVADNGTQITISHYDEDGKPVEDTAVTATSDHAGTFVVENRRLFGSLGISKEVDCEALPEELQPNADAEYAISIVLISEKGTAISAQITAVKTMDGAENQELELSFEDGVSEIALKAGETVSLKDIPQGYCYEVTEDMEGAAFVCTIDAPKGVVGEKTSVTVTNTYSYGTHNEGLNGIWVGSEDSAEAVSGGILTLYSDASCETEVGAVTPDAEGKFHFDISEAGTYYLKETETPAGYHAYSGTPVEVTAEEHTFIAFSGTKQTVTQKRMVIRADGLDSTAVEEDVAEEYADREYIFESIPIKPVTVKVDVKWDVPDGFTATPAAVDVQLYRNGAAYGNPVTLNADNGWKHSWSGAGMTDEYTWDVAQVEVPSGYSEYVVTEDGCAFFVVNKLEYNLVTVSVSKSWLNPKNYDEQPASVKVTLYRDGAPYETVTLGESNGWLYRWKQLPDCFKWTVDEPIVPENYKKKITHVGNAWVIINAHEEIPLTGDDSPVFLWAGAAAVAAAGFGVCLYLLQKKRKNDE